MPWPLGCRLSTPSLAPGVPPDSQPGEEDPLNYGEELFPVELTIATRGEDAGFIDFAHDTRDTRSPERISYRIWLSWSQPNFGGRRYWFCCPETGKRAAKLFLPRGHH